MNDKHLQLGYSLENIMIAMKWHLLIYANHPQENLTHCDFMPIRKSQKNLPCTEPRCKNQIPINDKRSREGSNHWMILGCIRSKEGEYKDNKDGTKREMITGFHRMR